MSAFLVSHDCIHRVVLGLRAFKGAYAHKDRDLLGMMLLELNRRAIKARYGELPDVEPYRYVERNEKPSPMQVYKSLRCFLYQCSEGDVPSQPLYTHTSDAMENLAEALGHIDGRRWESPANKAAYDECEWG